MPMWFLKTREDMDRYLAEQLERLQTDHLDFYLLHGLNGETWDKAVALGVREFLDEAQTKGLIRFPAFSFHGAAADFTRICDEYDFAFAQIQYNYMDIDFQAGFAGLRHAADKGMGVVVMEPLKGGKLAADLGPEVSALFDAGHPGWSSAEWALRFVLNDPGVSMLLSGMNSSEQLAENLKVASEAGAETLTAQELAVYDGVRQAMRARVKADCTACRYCMPCASGVDIPGVLAALNSAAMWNDPNAWLTGYTRVEGKANLCTSCAACEEVCPQGLPVAALMADAQDVFGE
jgi:predicted aldo/keto reductase-like oxidoreductase